jgi:hypothetical protein
MLLVLERGKSRRAAETLTSAWKWTRRSFEDTRIAPAQQTTTMSYESIEGTFL